MKKKVVAILLSAAMALSLAACGSTASTASVATDSAEDDSEESTAASGSTASGTAGNSTDGYEADDLSDIIPKDTVTLDVYDQLANYSGEQIGWFAKVIKDKFNVKLNIIPEASGTYDTRMESGNLGDIIVWGDDSDQYQQAVQKNMLYDWDEENLVSDYGPYISKNMKYALEKNKKISGGKCYGFGHDVGVSIDDRQSFMYEWDLRYDLYKQIGSPEIKNLDDMVDVLAKMKEACPTDDNGNPTYGVSLFKDWDGNMVMFVKSTASAYYGYDEFGFGLYDPEKQVYHDALEENGPYLTCLKFYNELYQKGLLDPDSQTQGNDGTTADYQNGTAFLNIFKFLGSDLYNTDAHLSAGKAMEPVEPTEATPICYGQNVFGNNRVWSIGANTENPELCMAIINWLSTPEGCLTYQYGPEGTNWTVDADGNPSLTDEGKKCKADMSTPMSGDYASTGTFKDGMFYINNTTWNIDAKDLDSKEGDTYNYINWPSYTSSSDTSDIVKDWQTWSGAKTADAYMAGNPFKLAIGSEYSASTKSDELAAKWQQVATCIKDNSWSAIYASSDDEFNSIVATMTQQAKEYGYDDCVAFQKNEATLRAAAENEARATASGSTETSGSTASTGSTASAS